LRLPILLRLLLRFIIILRSARGTRECNTAN
jgi:hypothetical protein